jgi:hypothetical protein
MKNDYTKEALDKTANSLKSSMYDNDFLKSTLTLLQAELDDLDTWSVYNDDKFNTEVDLIRKALELIKEQV